jgi:hypothetical protein
MQETNPATSQNTSAHLALLYVYLTIKPWFSRKIRSTTTIAEEIELDITLTI